jgi:hypothetical protein
MKQIFVAVGMLIPATIFASAQVIEKKEERPGVNVQVPLPGVSVEERNRVEERKRVEERRRDCDTKTVEKETPRGDKTVTTKRCD